VRDGDPADIEAVLVNHLATPRARGASAAT